MLYELGQYFQSIQYDMVQRTFKNNLDGNNNMVEVTKKRIIFIISYIDQSALPIIIAHIRSGVRIRIRI